MFIVTRQLRNRTESIICGFILWYHTGGFLIDRLNHSALNGSPDLSMNTKVKWIFQLKSALKHIQTCSDGFYSDLRLDNIVITDEEDVLLVDLEQCSSARRWLHPNAWPDPGNFLPLRLPQSGANPNRRPVGNLEERRALENATVLE